LDPLKNEAVVSLRSERLAPRVAKPMKGSLMCGQEQHLPESDPRCHHVLLWRLV